MGRERPPSISSEILDFQKAIIPHLHSTLLPQAAGRQQTDCVGTHHGNLTPPRISPSCPHCLIPVSPGAVAGQEYHYQIADEGRTGRSQPQCETARHRLLCGRMGTALHLPWPSLMRAHGPHRWSWRILQRRFSPPPGGPLVSGRIPLPDIHFPSCAGGIKLPPHCVGSEKAIFRTLFQKIFDFLQTLRYKPLRAAPPLCELLLRMSFNHQKGEQLQIPLRKVSEHSR